MMGVMMKYDTVVRELVIKPVDDSILSEQSITVKIFDGGAGPYVVLVRVDDKGKDNEVGIDRDEWPMVRTAINRLMGVCARLEG
jgi:hypothetical protein